MKTGRVILFIALLFILFAYVAPTRVGAMTAGELQNLKVVKHYFSTSIVTNNQKIIWTTDPAKGRYLVLTLSADAPATAWLFASDFVLSYFRNGDEDRAICAAIGIAQREDMRDVLFYAGTNPAVRVVQGKIYFALAFLIESGVDAVTIQRINGNPMAYHIGRERLYSVFIATNTSSQQLLTAVGNAVEDGGYKVVDVSDELVKEVSGTVIYYNEQSEREARDISQRLMVKFGFVPVLKKTSIMTAFDIIVWLGEKPLKTQF